MIVSETKGKRVPYRINLADTSVHTLIPSSSSMVKTLESLIASCKDTNTDFTLIYNDGTTDFPIHTAKEIVAGDMLQIKDFHLPIERQASLKVQASAANQITVIAISIDTVPVESAKSA